MRLWHYKLLPYLPKSQLIAQWRELNSIFKKQDRHILINYIYEYNKKDLGIYSNMVIQEMLSRGIKINNWKNYEEYFKYETFEFPEMFEYKPFKNHHNNRYLLQCFYNLQEKYDRGQKDFDIETFKELVMFVDVEINDHCELLLNLRG